MIKVQGIDWLRVGVDYRMGRLTIQQLAAQHGYAPDEFAAMMAHNSIRVPASTRNKIAVETDFVIHLIDGKMHVTTVTAAEITEKTPAAVRYWIRNKKLPFIHRAGITINQRRFFECSDLLAWIAKKKYTGGVALAERMAAYKRGGA